MGESNNLAEIEALRRSITIRRGIDEQLSTIQQIIQDILNNFRSSGEYATTADDRGNQSRFTSPPSFDPSSNGCGGSGSSRSTIAEYRMNVGPPNPCANLGSYQNYSGSSCDPSKGVRDSSGSTIAEYRANIGPQGFQGPCVNSDCSQNTAASSCDPSSTYGSSGCSGSTIAEYRANVGPPQGPCGQSVNSRCIQNNTASSCGPCSRCGTSGCSGSTIAEYRTNVGPPGSHGPCTSSSQGNAESGSGCTSYNSTSCGSSGSTIGTYRFNVPVNSTWARAAAGTCGTSSNYSNSGSGQGGSGCPGTSCGSAPMNSNCVSVYPEGQNTASGADPSSIPSPCTPCDGIVGYRITGPSSNTYSSYGPSNSSPYPPAPGPSGPPGAFGCTPMNTFRGTPCQVQSCPPNQGQYESMNEAGRRTC